MERKETLTVSVGTSIFIAAISTCVRGNAGSKYGHRLYVISLIAAMDRRTTLTVRVWVKSGDQLQRSHCSGHTGKCK
eukprot:12418954-Karenia_brevis.AAC.1